MNQREKILAACVGGLAALFVGNMVWSSVQAGIALKQDEVERLTKQVRDQKFDIQRGMLASQKITKATPRSASKRSEHARAEYERWLIQLIESSRVEDPSHQRMPDSRRKDGFHVYTFRVQGTGDLATATRMLHEFYAKPYLHRITQLGLRPLSTKEQDAGKLTIQIDCEFLSIPTAKDVQVSLPSNPALLTKSLEDYEKLILTRNVFSPPNQPPKFASSTSVQGIPGVALDHTVKADDPDSGQTVTYALDGDAPEGLSIDPATGRVRWTGKEVGDYQFTVKAMDSGLPQKSVTQTVKVKITPPPPPAIEPQKFDVASQAKLTGLVAGQQGAEAWVSSLTEGKTHKLRVGDELVLGDLKGKVLEVGANYVELESEGKRWTLGIFESVSEAYQRGLVD